MLSSKKLIIILQYVKICIRWCLFSIATGIVCGLVGTLFYQLIAGANIVRGHHPWLLYFLPLAGIIIVKFNHMLNLPEDRGADLIFDCVREQSHIPIQVIITSGVSAVATHLFGGSAGRVGVALQMGGGIASGLGKKFKLNPHDISLFTMCGMAGLVTVLFGAPLTATFLCMEVISVGVIYYAALLPCLLTSITSYFITQIFELKPLFYNITNVPIPTASALFKVGIFSVACAVVSIIFCLSIKELNVFLKAKLPNQYIRIVVGALGVILLTLLIGNQNYNGSGNELLIQALIWGKSNPWDFILKLLLTAVTLSCGFKGGGVFPAFIVGATFGASFGAYFGLPIQFAAAVGLVAVFSGTVNCPIASIFLGAELFGTEGVIFFAIASAVSFVFSGYFTLFPGQHFVYSKLRMEYKTSGLRRNDEGADN